MKDLSILTSQNEVESILEVDELIIQIKSMVDTEASVEVSINFSDLFVISIKV